MWCAVSQVSVSPREETLQRVERISTVSSETRSIRSKPIKLEIRLIVFVQRCFIKILTNVQREKESGDLCYWKRKDFKRRFDICDLRNWFTYLRLINVGRYYCHVTRLVSFDRSVIKLE